MGRRFQSFSTANPDGINLFHVEQWDGWIDPMVKESLVGKNWGFISGLPIWVEMVLVAAR